MPITQEQVDNWFSYHPPTPIQVEQYQDIRNAGKLLTEIMIQNCPDSADLTAAVRLVRQAVATANAAIACGGK